MCQSLQESKAVEQEAEQTLSDGGKLSPETPSQVAETHHVTPSAVENPEAAEQPPPESTAECCQPAAAPPPQPSEVPPPPPPSFGDLQPPAPPPALHPDRQSSRVFALPDGYRGIGGDLCPGYGSLSRASLHAPYWPAKNFQAGAHQTLPFLRDSYAPLGPVEGDNLLDMKGEHPTASYPTLGGIHQFRPITTMELLREPSRTR